METLTHNHSLSVEKKLKGILKLMKILKKKYLLNLFDI